MTILFYLIVVLHVIACLFLIAVVLLQQGKGQDLASAFGGGGTQTAFGPRGSATVLSRATTILAGVFMVTSLALVDGEAAGERRPRPGSGGGCEPEPRRRRGPGDHAGRAAVLAAGRSAGRRPDHGPAAAPTAAPSPAAK